jgi:ABC-type amino acid transport substrate-binding protein
VQFCRFYHFKRKRLKVINIISSRISTPQAARRHSPAHEKDPDRRHRRNESMNVHCMSLLRKSIVVASAFVALAASCGAQAGAVQDRVKASATVRVCIWPDYYGVTLRHPRTQQLAGIDIDLSAELARDIKATVQYVDSSFATLVDDLKADRCDIAMFAVGILPARAQQLAFTRPYMQSDIYGVTTKGNRVVARWEDIDKPGVAVAVQAGTFMEPVMAAELKQARLVRVSPPATRERELEAGRVDVFMTDYPYSRRLLDNADWATLISPPTPLHVLPYGYAVKQGDAAWLAAADEFVARIQRDGRLEAAAKRHGLGAIVRLR